VFASGAARRNFNNDDDPLFNQREQEFHGYDDEKMMPPDK
jgi:hypothetical protein